MIVPIVGAGGIGIIPLLPPTPMLPLHLDNVGVESGKALPRPQRRRKSPPRTAWPAGSPPCPDGTHPSPVPP